MTINELKEILIAHKKWLISEEGGKRAELFGADLHGADLHGADLLWADLSGANLSGANLSGANLYKANLYKANLPWANLYKADLHEANLHRANLYKADLHEANLHRANLCRANLCGAKNIPELPWLSIVPECGSFIGWKKVNSYIIKLKILEDAKRSNATGRKCRCSAAEVLEIQNVDGTKADIGRIRNGNYAEADYVVGEIVTPDSFDDDRWNECSHGIHFFITRQEAVEYI